MNNIDIFGNEKEEGVASTATTNNNNQENITNSINNINAVPSVILKSINVVDIISKLDIYNKHFECNNILKLYSNKKYISCTDLINRIIDNYEKKK